MQLQIALSLNLSFICIDAGAKAVKTASMQTEVVDGFQILRSNRCNETMVHLANWSKAISRKYGPLRVSNPAIT